MEGGSPDPKDPPGSAPELIANLMAISIMNKGYINPLDLQHVHAPYIWVISNKMQRLDSYPNAIEFRPFTWFIFSLVSFKNQKIHIMQCFSPRGPQLLEISYSLFEIFVEISADFEILKFAVNSVYCPFIHRKVAAKRKITGAVSHKQIPYYKSSYISGYWRSRDQIHSGFYDFEIWNLTQKLWNLEKSEISYRIFWICGPIRHCWNCGRPKSNQH